MFKISTDSREKRSRYVLILMNLSTEFLLEYIHVLRNSLLILSLKLAHATLPGPAAPPGTPSLLLRLNTRKYTLHFAMRKSRTDEGSLFKFAI